MKIFLVAALVMPLFAVSPVAFASPAPGPSTITYHRQDQNGPFQDLTQLNKELNGSLLQPGSPYLELDDENLRFTVGKQNYSLNNGLIAAMSGICSFRTTFKADTGSANFFYGSASQNIMAADFTATLQKYDNLNLEASYFKTDTPFMGITASGKIAKNIVVNFETSQNLISQAKGYVFATKCGNAQQQGDADLQVSYRYIEPGAISDYSANTDFDNSKGIRVETNYKFSDSLTLTAFQDFAQAQTHNNLNKNANNVTLTWNF